MIIVQHNSDSRSDASFAWLDALKTSELNGDPEIFFPRGEYHFYTGTRLKHCFISNNDESVKQIVFYLEAKKNLNIRGDHSAFIFHGRLLPFVLKESQNISISGISIDFASPFHFETELLETDKESSLLKVPGKWDLENGKLIVFNDGLDAFNGKLVFTLYDKKTGEISDPKGFHLPNRQLVCEKKNELLRVPIPMKQEKPHMIMRHQGRFTPAVLIDRCDDIVLENMTVYHAEGMAVVGQNSRNILLNKLDVIPAEGRDISVTDDAVHFSECEGRIEIRNCIFRQTLDDAVNIHGIYRRLKQFGNSFVMEACHFQQFGLWNGKPGDTLELLKEETMQPYAEIRCKSFSPGTKQLYCLELDGPLPPEFKSGDIVRIMRSAEMDVIISGSEMTNNMFRGILLSGAKRGLIENNRIHSPGNGIYISGDANYWYESGPVKNLEICGNTFDHCAYVAKNTFPILVDPIISRKIPGFSYHGSVNVHDNVFLTKSSPLVMIAHSVADLRFCRNQIHTDSTTDDSREFLNTECRNLLVMDNHLTRNTAKKAEHPPVFIK